MPATRNLHPATLEGKLALKSAAATPSAAPEKAPTSQQAPLSLNVVLTTIGRPQLARVLEAFARQLLPTDYLTLLVDGTPRQAQNQGEDWPERAARLYQPQLAGFRCPVQVCSPGCNLGFWGHGLRNRYQQDLPGALLWHFDDDNLPVPNARALIAQYCRSLDGLHCFLGEYRGPQGMELVGLPPEQRSTRCQQLLGPETPGLDSRLREANLDTASVVAPNRPACFGDWLPCRGGDGQFWLDTARRLGGRSYHHNQVLFRFRPLSA